MFYVIWYTDLCKFSGNDWKFWNSLGRKQQALWSLWWSLCGFGNFREKLNILFFFLEMLMILKISRFWKIIISKEEGQLWRWEGYIGGNCNVSHFREWWFLRKMQCISGQNYCVLLEKFLVQIAMHRWPGSGGFGPFSASELLNLLLLLLLWPFQIFLLIFKPNIS